MRKDEIVEEIHRIREEYAARFNYDMNLIYEDIKKRERESGREFVTLPPRPVEAVEAKEERQQKIS